MSLFRVYASLEIEMLILAEDKDEAIRVAKREWPEAIRDNGLEPYAFVPQQLELKADLYEEELGSLPYGLTNPQLPVEEYLLPKKQEGG